VRSFQLVSVFPTLTVSDMISVGAFARARRTFTMLEPAARFGPELAEAAQIASALGLSDSLSKKNAAIFRRVRRSSLTSRARSRSGRG
jgi:branched-chain amino acid transport system ATP-binding protein